MNKSILLADRHELFCQGLTAIIESEKSNIVSTHDGKDAWNIIQNSTPTLAILEIALPGMSGIDIARAARSSECQTQIIILTSCEDPMVAMSAIDQGVQGYILKRNSFERLSRALEIIVDGGTFVSPEIREKIRNINRNGKSYTDLSSRETDVLRLISMGNSSKQIARLMNVSPRTIDTYRERLMRKIEAHNLSDIIRFAMRSGIVD